MKAISIKADGYRGIWYMNQPSGDEYVYKYSGGLGTYCAKHQPFAVHCPEVKKTFFCYGGAAANDDRRLLHMVSYYDHATGTVPRPTLLLDKETDDAHDNPVISVDGDGHVWIFSTAHGTQRPACVHRSVSPYDVGEFEPVTATREENGKDVPLDNFSYMQAWRVSGGGFACFLTHYNDPATRTSFFMSSRDGARWGEWRRTAAVHQGHYQVSACDGARAGAALNFHPEGQGLNWRTNLYYMETSDLGATWRAADGTPLEVPLATPDNPALVRDYRSEGLNVYLKDMVFDAEGRPVILFLTSRGYEAGPGNAPRTWQTARWTGGEWEVRPAMTSDSNYDAGSLYIEEDGAWRIIAPTGPGPQPYNPGGEMVMWLSRDRGGNWEQVAELTAGSERNHNYARRPVNAHPDFYALWADGHGREPSGSDLYFCDRAGNVRVLPRAMEADFAEPRRLAGGGSRP